MKRLLQRFVLLVLFFVVTKANPMKTANAEDLLVAVQRSPRIETYSIDAATGAIKLKSTVELPGTPGPMTITRDKKILYVATRLPAADGQPARPGVTTLSRSTDGELKVIGTASIPAAPTYLSIDATGKWLFTAHYGEGQCAVIPVKDRIAQGEFSQVLKTDSRAHCIVLDKTNHFAFVPHTLPNKVFQFKIDAEAGKLVANDPSAANGPDVDHLYHEPRHIDFHPTLSMAYTSNERGGGISAWNYDAKKGTLELAQTLSSLPTDFKGNSAAADVHVSANGKFVYVSNRDVTQAGSKSGQDTLAGYSIDAATGRVTLIDFFKTGHVPRSFAINHSSQYVYVGGQQSNDLTIYKINQQNGRLEQTGVQPADAVPIWLMCVE